MNEIILGDCLDVMKTYPDNHFTSIVTDPPYGLHFMGKGWDHVVPEMSYWEEALRISKPGSFLISMGGTRTFHRLTCAIEDAGWEIRDCISWIYGSGFPKSHNHFGIEGYGTALKPAWEPCILAMKPLDGTFAQNVERWGLGGLNIDACRILTGEYISTHSKSMYAAKGKGIFGPCGEVNTNQSLGQKKRRWPANLILDEEAGAILDDQSGLKIGSGIATIGGTPRNSGSAGHILEGSHDRTKSLMNYGDSGGASRFFYCAKTSSKERNAGCEKNSHPTLKPLALMRYLITLVSPPKDALILDPFAGSGSTILAAKQLGINAVGIEKIKEYAEIAIARINSEEYSLYARKHMSKNESN